MKYLLDLSGIIDLETFHEYVSKRLDFPAHYGQNFDAFWDCLTEIESNTIIRIEGLKDLKKNLPESYNNLNKCINDYQQEYTQIEFLLFNNSPSGEGFINEV